MTDINIKIKDRELSDKDITKRNNFSTVYDGYVSIKSSYAKVASLWGAAIGMTIFLAFAATETLGTKSNDAQESTKNLAKKNLIGPGPQTPVQVKITSQPGKTEVTTVGVHKNVPTPTLAKQTIETEENKTELKLDNIATIETPADNLPASVSESKKINVKFIPQD
jgi:hypothetical protein